MRVGRLGLMVIVALTATAAKAAELTDLPPPSGVGIERGVATLQCEAPSGLLSTSRATVLDVGTNARGAQRSIEQVWRARGHAADPEPWLEELVADHARVRLVLRYAAAAQTDCRLEAWTSQRLLAHTCVTYPGTSGSPLVVGVDLEPVIIGLHVGSQLNWNGKELDMASVARPLDAVVIAAVEVAAAQVSQPKFGRRR